MLRISILAAAIGCVLYAPMGAHAAYNNDPTWPCIQRKVDAISLGQIWPHPPATPLPLTEADRRLAEVLALRRLTDDEAAEQIALYMDAQGGAVERDRLGSILATMLAEINRQRHLIIEGIARYAASQQTLVTQIEKLRGDIAAASAAATPDYDAIDTLERDLDWSQRIHKDREQSLLYVCESPILLEKHAFKIGKLLQARLRE